MTFPFFSFSKYRIIITLPLALAEREAIQRGQHEETVNIIMQNCREGAKKDKKFARTVRTIQYHFPSSFLPSFLPSYLFEELHLWTQSEEPLCIPFTPSCIKVCKRVRDTGPPSRFHLHNSLRRRSAIGRAFRSVFSRRNQETRGEKSRKWALRKI